MGWFGVVGLDMEAGEPVASVSGMFVFVEGILDGLCGW